MASDPSNPGNILASAIDAEVQNFRRLQEELQELQSDLQTVTAQETENDMVKQELSFLSDASLVYKMLGPVLIKQDLEDAQQTVSKRLEFIRDEKDKIKRKIDDKQERGQALAVKIQAMQKQLQETTAQALQAIAAEHAKN